MRARPDQTNINILIPTPLHQRLREMATRLRKSLRDVVELAIERHVNAVPEVQWVADPSEVVHGSPVVHLVPEVGAALLRAAEAAPKGDLLADAGVTPLEQPAGEPSDRFPLTVQLGVNERAILDAILDQLNEEAEQLNKDPESFEPRANFHTVVMAAFRCGLEEFEERGPVYARKFL